MADIVLNKFLLLSFLILIPIISSSAPLQDCRDQDSVNNFLETENLNQIKDCFKESHSSVAFREDKYTAYYLNSSDKSFYFSYPMIHNIDFYFFENGDLKRKSNYSKTNNKKKEYISYIPSKDDTKVEIVAITDSRNSRQLPHIFFDSQDLLINFIDIKNFTDGFWFGLVFIVISITILFYFVRRDKDLLYFTMHICSLFVIQLAFSGYLFKYFDFASNWILDRAVVFSCSFLTIGTVSFIYNNFKNQVEGKKHNALKLYFVGNYIAVLHFCYALFIYDQSTIKLTSYLTLYLSISTIFICCWAAFKKLHNSFIFLLALSLFLFSSLAFTLKDLGLLNLNEIHVNMLVKVSLIIEIFILSSTVLRNLHEENKLAMQSKINKRSYENALKIHHDIQSPLAALSYSYSSFKLRLSEEERELVDYSLLRIKDIIQGIPAVDESKLKFASSTFLIPLIDRLINEKRVEYSSIKIDLKLNYEGSGMDMFTSASEIAVSRALSNIINNSVEAIRGGDGITIVIDLRQDTLSGKIRFSISDNGEGIDKDDLTRISGGGVSIGKADGRGLGLKQVIEMLEKFDEKVIIESEVSRGTSVAFSLPLSEKPAWLRDRFHLEDRDVIIVDDDEAIQLLYQDVLRNSVRSINRYKGYKHFLSEFDPKKFVNPYFFVDFEFLGEEKTGIDLIEEFDIRESATLVTSHHIDKNLQKICIDKKIGMYPKDYISNLDHEKKKSFVLIDDDMIICKAWEMEAAKKGVCIKTYRKVSDFFNNLGAHPFDKTIVLIDSDLGDGVKGEVVSKEIFESGYRDIILTTGFSSDSIDRGKYISRIVGKRPNFDL